MTLNARTRLLTGLAGSLLVAACVSACSSNGPADSPSGVTQTSKQSSAPAASSGTSAPSQTSSSSTTAKPAAAVGPADVDAVPDIGKKWVGIRKDVKLGACTMKTGAAEASGTVTNTADSPRDVEVSVLWINAKSGATYAVKTFTKKALGAGDRSEFSLKATLPQAASSCVVQARSNATGSLK